MIQNMKQPEQVCIMQSLTAFYTLCREQTGRSKLTDCVEVSINHCFQGLLHSCHTPQSISKSTSLPISPLLVDTKFLEPFGEQDATRSQQILPSIFLFTALKKKTTKICLVRRFSTQHQSESKVSSVPTGQLETSINCNLKTRLLSHSKSIKLQKKVSKKKN